MEAELVVGRSGVFEVSVDEQVVVERSGLAFPTEAQIVAAVGKALAR